MNPLTLSLRSASQEVIIEDINGNPEPYELREMSAAVRDNYVQRTQARLSRDKEGNAIGIKEYDGLQASLIVLCLFQKEDGKAVTKEEVQKWPSTAVSQIYEAARKLNKLGDEEKVESEKND